MRSSPADARKLTQAEEDLGEAQALEDEDLEEGLREEKRGLRILRAQCRSSPSRD
jgi:hypothetical protein